jgi:hypothetical protein
MALTLAQLQAQREKILSGMGNAAQVQFSGGSVTHRPQAEMEAALQRVDAEIAALQSPQSRQFAVRTSRGLA